MLKSRFVPVAIDQAYHRRQQDTEGEFYRKIAGQSPRNDFQQTTQGFYVATAGGRLLLYNNNRDPDKLRRLMMQALNQFAANSASASPVDVIRAETVDPRYSVSPPPDGLVLRVRAKVLGGYDRPNNRWQRIFQTALSRDNLWISENEHQALVAGTIPDRLQQRIARFHCVDNTRGEPQMWRTEEIRKLEMRLANGKLAGSVRLDSNRRETGFEADMKGHIEVEDGKVARFDMVVLGEYWGDGPFTRGAPRGRYPLAIVFTLADGTDLADQIPPQGSRGWLPGYLP